IETARGKRIGEVRAGSAFLSQHSKWVGFGLGPEGVVKSARIRWPGGSVQELAGIVPGRRYQVVEGQAPAGEPFGAEPAPAPAPGVPGGEAPQSSALASYWLVDPLPVPDFHLADLAGGRHALSDYRGRPL